MLIRIIEQQLGGMPNSLDELHMAIIKILSEQENSMRTAVLGPIFSPDQHKHEDDLYQIEEKSKDLSLADWVVLDISSLVNCLELMFQMDGEESDLERIQKISDFLYEIITGPTCLDVIHFHSRSHDDILASILSGAANKSGIEVIYFD